MHICRSGKRVDLYLRFGGVLSSAVRRRGCVLRITDLWVTSDSFQWNYDFSKEQEAESGQLKQCIRQVRQDVIDPKVDVGSPGF